MTRHALPLNGLPGGAPEYIIIGDSIGEKGLTLIDDLPWTVSR